MTARTPSDKTKRFVQMLSANAEAADSQNIVAPEDIVGAQGGSTLEPKTKGLAPRMALLNDALGGNRGVVHFNPDNVRLDPQRCRPWLFHDRDIAALNEANCADLIDGFKEAGRQTTSGLVRPLKNDPEGFTYEIVVGLRRWWVCRFLGWQFEAEIRAADDGEAFIASDVENRSRQDISDYERAWKYRRALTEIYSAEGLATGRAKERHTQESLAAKLGKTAGWMTQLLDLTNLPEEIVRAFPSTHDILVNHGRRLKDYLDDSKSRPRVIARAVELATENKPRTAKVVVAELERAAKFPSQSVRKELGAYDGSTGKRAVRVERKGQRDLRFDLTTASVRDVDEALEVIEKALREHF